MEPVGASKRRALEILYRKVSRAREACAGSDRTNYGNFPDFLQEAYEFSLVLHPAVSIKLEALIQQIALIEDFGIRLTFDDALCDILNYDLKGYG